MANPKGPAKKLPENPSQENLRKQAKTLAREEGLQLAAAQYRIATEYGFQNWAELMRATQADFIPMLPLRALVAFPNDTYPIFIGREKSIKSVMAAEESRSLILMVTQKDPKLADLRDPAEIYEIGTLGVMIQRAILPDGTIKAMIEGKRRARVTRFHLDADFFKAEAEELDDSKDDPRSLEGLKSSVLSAFEAYQKRYASIQVLATTGVAIFAIEDPSILSDRIVGHLNIDDAQKQTLLESTSPAARLEKILHHLQAP